VLVIVDVGQEMTEFLLLNDVIETDQTRADRHASLLGRIPRDFLGKDLDALRAERVLVVVTLMVA
jgi:hypothetical protein